MKYIVKVGNMFVENTIMSPGWDDGSRLKNITLSTDKNMNMSLKEKNVIMNSLSLYGIKATAKEINDSYSLQYDLEFLIKRENKLQRIEQLFKSEVVDLEELTKLVKGDK